MATTIAAQETTVDGQIQRLAAYILTPEAGETRPPAETLGDPEDYPEPYGQLVYALQLNGDLEKALQLLPNGPRLAIAAHDPDRPTVQGSTWADLAEALGPFTWAWERWLPTAMLTEVVSEQGAGKSCLCLAIAACYVRGDPWPDGTSFGGQPVKVLWCEAESSQGLNLSRAEQWDLPTPMILSPLDDPLDDVLLQDPAHLDAIEAAAHRADVGLVVVDSLSGANASKENDAKVVHLVKWLASLAKTAGKPVILTHHLRKKGLMDGGDGISLDRIRGSSAITQPARVVWALDTPDPQDPETRRLSVIKNNLLGVKGSGGPLGMRIDASGVTFTNDAPEAPRVETQQGKAADLLMALLRKGPMKSTNLQDEIEGAGLSWDAAKRAKKRLGIVATRAGDVWQWGLPSREL